MFLRAAALRRARLFAHRAARAARICARAHCCMPSRLPARAPRLYARAHCARRAAAAPRHRHIARRMDRLRRAAWLAHRAFGISGRGGARQRRDLWRTSFRMDRCARSTSRYRGCAGARPPAALRYLHFCNTSSPFHACCLRRARVIAAASVFMPRACYWRRVLTSSLPAAFNCCAYGAFSCISRQQRHLPAA